jgi:hypothetical protein
MKNIRNLSLLVLGILSIEAAFRIPKYCWAGCPEVWLGYVKLAQLALAGLLAFKTHQNMRRQMNKTM